MASLPNGGATGGAASGADGEGQDQYYRELLARVDNAIVETREPASNGLENCCKTCAQRAVAGGLLVAAVAIECCVSLKIMLMPSAERPPSAATDAPIGTHEI